MLCFNCVDVLNNFFFIYSTLLVPMINDQVVDLSAKSLLLALILNWMSCLLYYAHSRVVHFTSSQWLLSCFIFENPKVTRDRDKRAHMSTMRICNDKCMNLDLGTSVHRCRCHSWRHDVFPGKLEKRKMDQMKSSLRLPFECLARVYSLYMWQYSWNCFSHFRRIRFWLLRPEDVGVDEIRLKMPLIEENTNRFTSLTLQHQHNPMLLPVSVLRQFRLH